MFKLLGGTGYNGTKHALEAISDGSRLELAPFGISVSTINPGFMRTEIMNKLEVEYLELTQAQKELYPNFFKKIKEIKEMLQYADTVESGPMPAVIHAITSPRPKTRYLVASIGGVPAWFMAYLKWFLPASTFDKLSLEGETLPHKKTQRVHHLR